MKPLAVICKFYDEPDLLPIWVRHYGRQVGSENCYLIDHGSDDGTQFVTERANTIRLLRSPQDDYRHLAIIQDFARELLKRYRYVLHVDADELVVADPARHRNLTDYAAACSHDVVSMIGLELQQITGSEPPLDPARPVLGQRKHVWFNSALCKPALTRGPLDWSPGFHCMPHQTVFDDLYLFHLRYFDREIGLRRLHRSRNQPWSHPGQASHQRLPDKEWLARQEGAGRREHIGNISAEQSDNNVKQRLDAVIESRVGREGQQYRIALDICGPGLWHVPERFFNIF